MFPLTTMWPTIQAGPSPQSLHMRSVPARHASREDYAILEKLRVERVEAKMDDVYLLSQTWQSLSLKFSC